MLWVCGLCVSLPTRKHVQAIKISSLNVRFSLELRWIFSSSCCQGFPINSGILLFLFVFSVSEEWQRSQTSIMSAELDLSPPEVPEPTFLESVLRYGLFLGAIFQLICILAIIFPTTKGHEHVCVRINAECVWHTRPKHPSVFSNSPTIFCHRFSCTQGRGVVLEPLLAMLGWNTSWTSRRFITAPNTETNN